MTEEEDGLPINVDRNSSAEEGEDAGKSSKKRKAVSRIVSNFFFFFCNTRSVCEICFHLFFFFLAIREGTCGLAEQRRIHERKVVSSRPATANVL